MYCKHCGAQIGPEEKVCSGCGAVVEENKLFTMNKTLQRVISIVLCVALVIGLAYLVFLGAGGTWEDITEFVTDLFVGRENNIYYKDSYTADEKKLDQTGPTVIATMGEHTLTNSRLQVFYWMQIYDFIEQVGGYTSYYGLDLSKPLNEQVCDSTTGQTWQQAFLENALNAWTKYTLIYDDAAKNGFKLPEDYQKQLDEMEANLSTSAEKNNFESVDAMLQSDMGKGITLDDYKYYLEMYYMSNLYLNHMTENLELKFEEIDTWYENNKGSLEQTYGITKESGNMTDVRHLLVSVAEVAGEEKSEYTDAEWEVCRQKAQALLDQWLAGEKTEDSFSALVTEKTDDTASAATGGLYTYVFKNGQYVEEFEAWCIDSARAKGDYGLVKTSYGYHIMYCVDTEAAWIRSSRDSLLSEKTKELWASFSGTAEIDFTKIAIAAVTLQKA